MHPKKSGRLTKTGYWAPPLKFLVQYLWGEVWEWPFLTSSQVTLMPLTRASPRENHGVNPYWEPGTAECFPHARSLVSLLLLPFHRGENWDGWLKMKRLNQEHQEMVEIRFESRPLAVQSLSYSLPLTLKTTGQYTEGTQELFAKIIEWISSSIQRK